MKETKKFKTKYLLYIIIAILIVLIIIYFLSTRAYAPSYNNETLTNDSNTISLSPTEKLSAYEIKQFDSLPHLSVENLSLTYENNITTIKFNLNNSSENEQEPFDFTFSLLDEINNTIITFDLSLKENLKNNTTKEFVLIATRDVSNAYDYEISINE